MHAYNETNYDSEKGTRKTISGYALLNNAVSIPSRPYGHKHVFILIKALEYNPTKEK